MIFSSGDRANKPAPRGGAIDSVRRFVTLPTSQKAHPVRSSDLAISPGDRTFVRVYDDVSGRLKYQLEAESWEPLGNDTDYHVKQLRIQIYTPRGETTSIHSDEADVTVVRKSKNRLDAQSGKLIGHVRVVFDRTTSKWREQHPDKADPQSHPEELIHINMETAEFDMDRAELLSKGPVVMDSEEAHLDQVSGLSVHWDQSNNRIEFLRFDKGGRMVLHRGSGLVSFAMPGVPSGHPSKNASKSERQGGVANQARTSMKIPKAQANQPVTIGVMTAEEAAADIRATAGRVVANQPKSIYQQTALSAGVASGSEGTEVLRSPQALSEEIKTMTSEARSAVTPDDNGPFAALPKQSSAKSRKIHTYQAVFNHEVHIEQFDGDKSVGDLLAEKVEVHFDFAGQQRRKLRGPSAISGNRPVDTEQKKHEAHPAQRDMPIEPIVDPVDQKRIILTWNGPLELRPLSSDTTPPSGKRFDVIATGQPVKTHSEQGNAICRQLVYRGERRQIWLSGNEDKPVEMSVGQSRRLVGRELFFDQKRGLGRVDGAGYLFDARQPGSRDAVFGMQPVNQKHPDEGVKKKSKQPAPVKIRWSRGLDLEIGSRPVSRFNAETGLKQMEDREFLQRAWFHGDVLFEQGEDRLSADEIAATFGIQASGNAFADYIEHLNMLGEVRLQRKNDQIEAQRFDVDLILTPDGRNSPRTIDAAGEVQIRQLQRTIRAKRMHVVLARYPRKMKRSPNDQDRIVGSAGLGIESLDATGNVVVQDPQHNLKIRRAESLKTLIRNGNELVRVTIVSASPHEFARARYEDSAIHGHHIDFDLDRQTIDVPGPGKAWMVTRQDFGGRQLPHPTAVKTTWSGKMQLRMAANYAVFVDQVHSESNGFVLNGDKLTIRFAKAPPIRQKKDQDMLERFGFGRLGLIKNDQATLVINPASDSSAEKKRPAYIVVEGHAEAISSTYAPSNSKGDPGRLLSRARVAGCEIVADLARQQMSVPCAGTLLIEDYQFQDRKTRLSDPLTSRMGMPLMSSMGNEGPSQSLVTWENSMDFFVDRGLVSFDKNVTMVHRSGRKMVMKELLAESMHIDPSALRHLGGGQKATLTCGNLLLEFLSGQSPSRRNKTKNTIVRATDLERLIAQKSVHLQDGTKSLMGDYLQFLHGTHEVRLEGSRELEARIIDQEEGSQRLSMWRGPVLLWNRLTNRVETTHAHIRTSRG